MSAESSDKVPNDVEKTKSQSPSWTFPTSMTEVYNQISFKDSIAKYREEANHFVQENIVGRSLAFATAMTAHPIMAMQLAEDKVSEVSRNYNKNYPLLGSITNTHQGLVLGITTSIVALPALSM